MISSIFLDIKNKLLKYRFLIIRASPGSGKTTEIPKYLRSIFKAKIYILEPRQLAAKMAATFVAKSLGSSVGDEVGYAFKYDRKLGPDCHVCYVTEGTFIRMLSDPTILKNTDVIILDEFHERHLATDLALALILKLIISHPHIKIIIMSATIQLDGFSEYVKEEVGEIEFKHQRFLLQINYLQNIPSILNRKLESLVLDAIQKVIDASEFKRILVFLPGMNEINLAQDLIKKYLDLPIAILHGGLPAVEWNTLADRCIILATNIAESSVTIPGVNVVIDSGLSRESELCHLTRQNKISVKKISKSSAIQRAHRSNRINHGVVFRLYSEMDYLSRNEYIVPEILRTDLTQLVYSAQHALKLNVNKINFYCEPKKDEWEKAFELLKMLGVMDSNNELNWLGVELAETGFAPRYSKIFWTGANNLSDDDFKLLVEKMSVYLDKSHFSLILREVSKCFNKYKKLSQSKMTLEEVIFSGFVDQIMVLSNKKEMSFTHQSGKIIKMHKNLHHLIDINHPWYCLIEMSFDGQALNVIPIELDWIYSLEPFLVNESESYTWNKNILMIEKKLHVGMVVFEQELKKCQDLNPRVKKMLFKEWFDEFYQKLDLNRLYVLEKFSHKKIENFNIEEWFLEKINFDGHHHLAIELQHELKNYLDPEFKYNLELDLPLFFINKAGLKMTIEYDRYLDPYIENYMQYFFGLTTLPVLMKGQLKVMAHVWGPNKLSLQVTKDLENFWNKTYPEMRGQLKRDYPRHHWPENPASAPAILLQRQLVK